jgi:hypothetical protein
MQDWSFQAQPVVDVLVIALATRAQLVANCGFSQAGERIADELRHRLAISWEEHWT